MAEAKMTQLDPPLLENKSSKLNISFIKNRKIRSYFGFKIEFNASDEDLEHS